MSNFKQSLESSVLKDKFMKLLESIDRNNTSKMIVERHFASLASLEIAEGKVNPTDAYNELKGMGFEQNQAKNIVTSSTINEGKSTKADRFLLERVSILEKAIKDLKAYDWMAPVDNFIKESTEFLKDNQLNILIEGVMYDLEIDKNAGYYSKAISKLVEASTAENPAFFISENLENDKWIPLVKQLVEHCNNIKGSTNGHNPNFKVSRIYSPVEFVGESYVFNVNDKNFETDGNTISESNSELSESFKKLVAITESAKFESGVMKLYPTHNSIVGIDFSEGEPKVEINNKLVESSNVESHLIAGGYLKYNEIEKASTISHAIAEGKNIKEIDFGYKVSSSIYSGVSVNIFNVNENIYIQKINPAMKENSFLLAESAEDAVMIVKDFMNYDITGSLTHLLENEKAENELRSNEIKKIEGRIKFLKESKENLERAAKVNGVENTSKIKAANELLDTQISEQTEILSKLTSSKSVNEHCVPGKEYTINGEPGWIYQGDADGNHIYNYKDGGKQPKNYSDAEYKAAEASGEIV